MQQNKILPLFDDFETLPKRSRLMPLTPAGEKTAMQESLSSYFIQLARAHSCYPLALLKSEVIPWTKIKYDKGANSRFAFKYLKTMNGVGLYASEFVNTLKNLTGRSDLDRCTFLGWQNILDPRGFGLLHIQPRWCVECFRGWRESGVDPYFPLLWMAAPVQYCPDHKCMLSDRCPSCGHVQPFLPKHVYLDHCSYCGGWLASGKAVNYLEGEEDYLSYQTLAMTEAIVEGPSFFEFLKAKSVSKIIKNVSEKYYDGNIFKMERDLGFGRGTIKNWVDLNNSPSLPNLLLLSYRLGLTPLRLLTSYDFLDFKPNSFSYDRKPLYKPGGLSGGEYNRVENTLNAIIKSGVSEKPLSSVAHDVGHKAVLLRYWFKEQCRSISQLHREYKKMCRNKNELADIEVVRVVFEKLCSGKLKITNRLLRKELSLHRVVLSRPHVLAAVKKEKEKRLYY